MKNLESLFTSNEVLSYFAKKRAATATDTASKNYFDNFGPSGKSVPPPDINTYFPPRSVWFNAKPKKRNGKIQRLDLSTKITLTIQKNSPWGIVKIIDQIGNHSIRMFCHENLKKYFDIKRMMVQHTLACALGHTSLLARILKLDERILIRNLAKLKKRNLISYWTIVDVAIRTRKKISCLGKNEIIVFNPTFIPAAKDAQTYRLLCKFNSEESLILAQTSRYMRSISDEIFSSHSYAFRCPPKNKKMPTHHDAITKMHKFIEESYKKNLEVFIAECDIKKFFDSIPHDTIQMCLKDLEADLAKKGKKIDQNALKIIAAFLKSYNFPKARKQAHDILITQRKTNKEYLVCFPWIDQDPIYLSNPTEAIGIPQGSALSCFIANLVLHYADVEVEKNLCNGGIYSRYCDDMVILTNTQQLTDQAFQSYINKLTDLKLPFHPPKAVSYKTNPEKAAFWDCKSKATYKLSKNDILWCGFVGYQIAYDGKIRPRLNSFRKEILKQREVADGIISRIRNSKRMKHSIASTVMSANRRMVARAAGKGDGLLLSTDESTNMSWVGGFDRYAHPYGIKKWGRELDRSKVKILKSLAGRLYSMKKKGSVAYPASIKPTKQDFGPYLGRKYSYARRSR